MKRTLLILCILLAAIQTQAQTLTRGEEDFAHGFSAATGSAGKVSYTYGTPFYRQPGTDDYTVSLGVMQAQLVRVDMRLEGNQNDSLAVSPTHVQDTSGFFQGYEGEEMVFDGKTIRVFLPGHYDSTALGAAHYSWNAQYNYDSLTTLVLDVWPIYELFDTLWLDSAEIVTDYATNVLNIPAYAWHSLHGGPNDYRLKTEEHQGDSLRHFFVNLCGGVVKDADGNEYASVYIGNVPARFCWSKPNMRTTTYVAGGSVPSRIYNAEGHTDTLANVELYGRLYDWYAAVNLPYGSTDEPPYTNHGHFVTGICPAGWHVPDSANMVSLESMDAFGLMSDTLWLIPGYDSGAGMYIVPSGFYNYETKRFENMLGSTYLWSSVRHNLSKCWVCSFLFGCNMVLKDDIEMESGASVRCVKNQVFDSEGNELND
ncbi:MAG: fibrobacter succinogenes major paralogous domain-containing protein [Bacteroidales bacterium]|nr:fibrobacter succinogenes major paralogous domain-containing protein [Bacteroidales bacterium]